MATYPNAVIDPTAAGRNDLSFGHGEALEIYEEIAALQLYVGASPHVSSVLSRTFATLATRVESLERSTAALGRTGMTNLRVFNNVATPNSKVDITCDSIAIEGVLLQSLALTVDITLFTGSLPTANGRDFSSEAASTWYFLWLIYSPATNAVASLISSSSVTPSMPAGYTLKRRIGCVRNDSGSNFLRFRQDDGFCQYDLATAVLYTASPGGPVVLNGGTANTITAITAAATQALIPPTSRRAYVWGIVKSTASPGFPAELHLYPGDTVQTGTGHVICSQGTAAAAYASSTGWITTDASQGIKYKLVFNTNSSATLEIWGYYDPIG